jgi:hypothetical protein
LPVKSGGSFHRGKAAGMWNDHSPPSDAKVKNVWSYTSRYLHSMMLN